MSTSLSRLAREAFDRERFEVDMLLFVHRVGVAGRLRLLWRSSLRWWDDFFAYVCALGGVMLYFLLVFPCQTIAPF